MVVFSFQVVLGLICSVFGNVWKMLTLHVSELFYGSYSNVYRKFLVITKASLFVFRNCSSRSTAYDYFFVF